jgi:hypothetical protein
MLVYCFDQIVLFRFVSFRFSVAVAVAVAVVDVDVDVDVVFGDKMKDI